VSRLAIAAALALAAVACKEESAEFAGVGPWSVTKTKLADATGRCDPTDLPDGRKGMYCYLQPLLPVAKQGADVDLYFGGTEPTAPLVELQLKVKICRPEPTETWLRSHFGAPFEIQGTRLYFKNRYLYMAADLSGDQGHCLLRVFPLSEQAEFERVKAQATAPAPAPAKTTP